MMVRAFLWHYLQKGCFDYRILGCRVYLSTVPDNPLDDGFDRTLLSLQHRCSDDIRTLDKKGKYDANN